MPRLENKVAIVTGAASGIGRAVAQLFHNEGAMVICADIREGPDPIAGQELELATHDFINQQGGSAEFFKVDVTKAADVEALVARAVEKYGRLDIMVNNAGVSIESPNPKGIWEFPQDAWEKDFAVNATGVMLGVKYASAQMMMQEPWSTGDRGWIVNTASVHGLVGMRGLAGYSASKHAVMGLTKSAAQDCAPYRIHVNAVCPGVTETAFLPSNFPEEIKSALLMRHPFRGFGRAEDIAKAVLFLASEDNTWITGIGLQVDGGALSM
ncbi:putative short chain type dehydrogenase [Paraphoma chrysanthemicola]|nr:putative short chain type dehydrogenase [Paraphoma chrysanthemicola]